MTKALLSLSLAGLTLLCTSAPSLAQAAEDAGSDLSSYLDLSLEALLNQEITSANKRPQLLSDVAAAAYVITEDEIRASGAGTLPEVLRLAPGVDVAQISGDRWAVSIRGFTGTFANKLLVLVDGRSAFTPSFNGVIWNSMLFPLENIERIEVIRGPGGSVWGVNAVNGVINIITKSSRTMQGTQVIAGAGSERRTFLQARHGAAVGTDSTFSAYVKGASADASVELSGKTANDAHDQLAAGFRFDRETGPDSWQLSGNLYRKRTDGRSDIPDPTSPQTGYARRVTYTDRVYGANLIGRFNRRLGPASNLALQLSWSRDVLDLPVLTGLAQEIFDMEMQHTFRLGERHDLTWGLAYRRYHDDTRNGQTGTLLKDEETLNIASVFAQDEVALSDTLRLTAGARLDHQKYSGSEFQPSLSLLWNLDATRSVWTSVSRAARIPSRGERTGEIDLTVTPPPRFGPLPVLTVAQSSADIDAEKMTSFEIGYRGQETETLFVDVTAYIHRYKDLITTGTPNPADLRLASGYLVLPITFDNIGSLTSRGIEVATSWQISKAWRVRGSYAYNEITGNRLGLVLGDPPRHIFSALSSWRLDARTDLNLWVRHVGMRTGYADQDVEGYTTADLRLAWRPERGVELSLVGQNLFDNQHPEFISELPTTVPTQVQRGIYGQIRIDF